MMSASLVGSLPAGPSLTYRLISGELCHRETKAGIGKSAVNLREDFSLSISKESFFYAILLFFRILKLSSSLNSLESLSLSSEIFGISQLYNGLEIFFLIVLYILIGLSVTYLDS